MAWSWDFSRAAGDWSRTESLIGAARRAAHGGRGPPPRGGGCGRGRKARARSRPSPAPGRGTRAPPRARLTTQSAPNTHSSACGSAGTSAPYSTSSRRSATDSPAHSASSTSETCSRASSHSATSRSAAMGLPSGKMAARIEARFLGEARVELALAARPAPRDSRSARWRRGRLRRRPASRAPCRESAACGRPAFRAPP